MPEAKDSLLGSSLVHSREPPPGQKNLLLLNLEAQPLEDLVMEPEAVAEVAWLPGRRGQESVAERDAPGEGQPSHCWSACCWPGWLLRLRVGSPCLGQKKPPL